MFYRAAFPLSVYLIYFIIIICFTLKNNRQALQDIWREVLQATSEPATLTHTPVLPLVFVDPCLRDLGEATLYRCLCHSQGQHAA